MAILFGTNRQFNLERLPFSVAGAFLSIYQDVEDKNLYFTICRSEGGMMERPKLLKLTFLADGEELPFIYECDAAKLTVTTKKGTAEFTYEEEDIMRVRVTGITLRVFFDTQMHEGGVERAPGEVEMAFNLLGKLLFKQLSGKMENNARWNFREVCPFPFSVELSPGGGTSGECAIHEYYTNVVSKKSYAPFDEAYAAMFARFVKFTGNYAPVAIQYRDMAERAMWVVWQSRLGPRGGHGGLKDTAVYMHKLFLDRAFGWQQCFHAIASANNAKEAWRLLLSFFHYQDAAGGIPDNISDLNQYVWISTKPPLYGFACCFVLDHFDTSTLTREDYAALYEKLTRFTAWWFTHHDHAKTGIPAYYHVDESGYDESALFDGGLPLQAPDLQAYVVMLCEACSRLAALLDDRAGADRWAGESKRVLDFLVNDLWDGSKFRAKLPATGKYYSCNSLALLQPVMLGSRLPKEILRVIAERVADPEEFLTDFGMATENLKSPEFMMRSFTRGPVIAPAQMLILLGLYEGGEKETARTVAARYLNALLAEGLALAVHPYRVEPVTGDQIVEFRGGMSVTFPFTAWAASIFLALAGYIMR
ncbi:MAG: hypothetical protein LBC88_07815 [Spirochaetaceae bacterium]|jgi:hypothetical protein|nr:hypothetical protein [Spirochaetaceae bacterium]